MYCFPRFTVFPQHAAKALIPRTECLSQGKINDPTEGADTVPAQAADASHHEMLQGVVVGLTADSVSVLLPNAEGSYDDVADDGSDAPPERIRRVPFDYAVYALGSGMPAPCDVWGEIGRTQYPGRGTKRGTIDWLTRYGAEVRKAKRVLVVGGGALGIQYATDIKETAPDVDVTLLHSRAQLLPVYDRAAHDIVVQRFEELGIAYALDDRVVTWPENPGRVDGAVKTVTTQSGKTYDADVVLVCTGPRPHVEQLAALDPAVLAPSGRIRVDEHLRVDTDALRHVFAVGDAADTKAILAGHMANAMAGLAARNILRLIQAEQDSAPAKLEQFVVDPAMQRIKISLGIRDGVVAGVGGANRIDTGVEDIGARGMWAVYGAQDLPDDA